MHLAVDALVTELIATGVLDETTVDELKAMQAQAAAGTLDADDESYIRALHARITNAPAPEPIEIEPERPDGLTLAEWRDRALAADAEAATLRDQIAAATPAG